MEHESLGRAEEVLRETFGLRSFRPVQRTVVASMLAGRDVLAVLPTGTGKSVCFQVPAVLDSGLTLVVSPLISLMHDQVARLLRVGVPAASLTSAEGADARRQTEARVLGGKLRLLYVSPERLRSGLSAVTEGAMIARVIVDEAHCVSEWGHDFRPDYRAIAGAVSAIAGRVRPPIAAFTATATAATRADIAASLGLRRPVVVTRPVDRPNLIWHAVRTADLGDAVARVVDDVRRCAGSAIVYVPTRKRAEQLSAILRRHGSSVRSYHAGLPAADRAAVQSEFLGGAVRVVCATNAFGMGIDHSGVRLVSHMGMPSSLEAYVQEAGRAGRDGQIAACRLVVCPEDRRIQTVFIRGRPSGDLRRRARHRLAVVERYVRSRHCRRRFIAHYFGDPAPRCSGCDRCGLP